jgi:hypothetical protein
VKGKLMKCFFNLAGAVYDPDKVGIELDTIRDVRVVAARHIADVIRDMPDLLWAGDEIRLEVTDESRMILFTIVTFGINAPAISGQHPSFRP